jgi:hypothetical protein
VFVLQILGKLSRAIPWPGRGPIYNDSMSLLQNCKFCHCCYMSVERRLQELPTPSVHASTLNRHPTWHQPTPSETLGPQNFKILTARAGKEVDLLTLSRH